jgi:sec-independent protein translocase protein TatC
VSNPTAAGAAGGEMSLWDHLGELRSRLVKSILAVAVGAAVVFSFYDQVLDWLTRPYCRALASASPGQECTLVITDVLEGFRTRVRVAIYGGIALAMPVLLWQLWRFVTPALYPRERRYAIPFVASGVLLFALGAGLAYWSLERAIDFLITVSGEDVETLLRPSPYMSFVVFMMLAFGVGFEFPIVLVFLQLAGIIEPDQLSAFRRYAVVGIVVLVAIITPSGDPITLAALTIPMYIFYEISIVIGRLLTRNRRPRLPPRIWHRPWARRPS